MSDMRSVLVDTANKLFSKLCSPRACAEAEKEIWQPDLWAALQESGLTDATVTAARGGAGADLGDALAVIHEAGAYGLPAPLAETMLAELVLAAAGLGARSGVLTVGPVLAGDHLSLTKKGNAWAISGTLHRVPWGRHATAVAVSAQVGEKWATAIVKSPTVSKSASNFAHEPRDDLHFDDYRLSAEEVSVGGSNMNPEDLQFCGALFRVAAMTGALSRILGMTVEYALQREQFGRPIAKFQAVQQQIAVLASQVAASSAAYGAALEASHNGLAHFEIAAAKARVSEAAGIAVSIAHQVHGAMGFTHEHPLHRSTRRLWSWRDEFGSEHDWAAWIGSNIARLGGAALWPFLTSSDKTTPIAATDHF